MNTGTNDIVGKKFGKLTVLNYKGRKGNHYIYTCRCDCTNIVDKDKYELTSGKTTRCEKCYKKEKLQSQIDECLGKKFGKLIVVSFAGLKNTNKEGEHLIMYNCKCDCGGTKGPGTKVVSKKDLKSGAVKSCGCLYEENLDKLHNETNVKHGFWKDPIYQCYYDMMDRCYNPNNKNYFRYGGRGITVCDEWRQPAPYGFLKFKEDMNQLRKDFKTNNPEAKITINRIDNDGNYCPANCEWSDMYSQNNNTSRNKHYLYYGEWYTVAQLITNFAPYLYHSTLSERIERLGYQDGDEITNSSIFNPSGYNIEKEINCPILFIDNFEQRNN